MSYWSTRRVLIAAAVALVLFTANLGVGALDPPLLLIQSVVLAVLLTYGGSKLRAWTGEKVGAFRSSADTDDPAA